VQGVSSLIPCTPKENLSECRKIEQSQTKYNLVRLGLAWLALLVMAGDMNAGNADWSNDLDLNASETASDCIECSARPVMLTGPWEKSTPL